MTEEMFKVRMVKLARGGRTWQVYVGDDRVDEVPVLATYPDERMAEDHAARLNAANQPEKPKGPFRVLPDSTDEEDHYGVYVNEQGTDDEVESAWGSHDEDRCNRLKDLLNQLVADFDEGIVG